ncbi:BHMT1 methyltransferase, partial [Prunella fulvescens]|nr:BHMT1 methyltransferase [Prunella fulvescens]
QGILERLDAGEIVIGDGGFVFALEKRGYVKAGPWTPEATVEHPEAVRQLHREFLRAGSNVLQTFTFYASEDKLENRGNYVAEKISCHKVNEAACDIAREVADEGDALVAGGVSQTPSYLSCKDKSEVKAAFQKQLEVFMKKNVDFLIAEAVWAVEVLKESGKPVAATMCIGPEGDMHGVSPGQCAVQLVKAGASIVGVNCHFDPETSIETVRLMKEGLQAAKLKAHLMCQPLAFHTPDYARRIYFSLEFFSLFLYFLFCFTAISLKCHQLNKDNILERNDLVTESMHNYLKGRYIKGANLGAHYCFSKEYWENLKPASGRPYCPCMSKPDGWGVTRGAKELMQQKEATTEQQLKELFQKKKF